MDYLGAARHIAKRSLQLEQGDGNIRYKLPTWGYLLILADFIVFLPIVFYLGYTLNKLYPTLAIIENPNPPAYEPLATADEPETGNEDNAAAPLASSTPITSSLRRTNRLIYSIGGWKSNFRGLGVFILVAIATGILAGIFSAVPFVGSSIGTLLASLALVQLSTAWVHIIITTPSSKSFRGRLLPFKRVFEATCFPILISWVAMTINQWVPILLSWALHIKIWNMEKDNAPPEYHRSDIWKSLIIVVVSLLINIVIVLPAHVLLVRVQASLLPGEEDTVVPFDRSYEGKVEPALVGGKGYVSMRDALSTFSRGSWIRLYKLYAKIIFVSFLLYLLMMAVIIPEIIVMVQKTTREQPQ